MFFIFSWLEFAIFQPYLQSQRTIEFLERLKEERAGLVKDETERQRDKAEVKREMCVCFISVIFLCEKTETFMSFW